MRYIVFDVETPNHYNNRISAIGITVLEDEQIASSFFSYKLVSVTMSEVIARHKV